MRNNGWNNDSSRGPVSSDQFNQDLPNPPKLVGSTIKNLGTMLRKQTNRFQAQQNAKDLQEGPIHPHNLAIEQAFSMPSSSSVTLVGSAGPSANYSSNRNNSSTPDAHHHPYVTIPMTRPQKQDTLDDEAECPVCLEPMSFSFRLPGEKPHVIPECGHALHEACFSAVYGPTPGQARPGPRKANLGVCGVCRRPMKVGDGEGGKSNKLAALTGMGESTVSHPYPGRNATPMSTAFNPNEDDPLDHHGHRTSPSTSKQSSSVTINDSNALPSYVVTPAIQVHPEFQVVTRTPEKPQQPLTCIVVIEIPGKRRIAASAQSPPHPYATIVNSDSAHGHNLNTNCTFSRNGQPQVRSRRTYSHDSSEGSGPPQSPKVDSRPLLHHEQHLNQQTEIEEQEDDPVDSPFAAITEDLNARIADWKGHPLEGLGRLQMYDLLSVRRDSLVREFFVYLFKEALICVVEEKKRGFPNPTITAPPAKGVLKLKGRIYVRHIKRVTAQTSPAVGSGEMTLTIDMEDERLDSFVLIFKDRTTLEAWKTQIQGLVDHFQGVASPPSIAASSAYDPSVELDEFGGRLAGDRNTIASHTNTQTGTTTDSLLNGSAGSVRSTQSSSTSYGGSFGSRHNHGNAYGAKSLGTLGEDDERNGTESYDDRDHITPSLSTAGPSNTLPPLPHAPLDLILILSIPPPASSPSTAALKIKVIKSSLDFVLSSLGPKDRLSLVTFEVGLGGQVRKTPYLSIGKPSSVSRIRKFIEETGANASGDLNVALTSPDEKTDVVTAVNHGLDVVLQRKNKNSVSGMILVSDAADSTRRTQMDLVLARAEAANVAIHSFGYGRSHDPASLWLMSTHTGGTYTFVKDWYGLRDCLAGCVGGMMSVGLLNLRLHLRVVDSSRFRIRKISGGPPSVVASSGQDVDIDVGELRFGERKEMLVELELDNTDAQSRRRAGGVGLDATDAFVQSMGLDALGDGPSDGEFMDGMMDRMIDEVPVFEIDGSFFDPACGKQISRLTNPVLLTITLQATAPNSTPISDPLIVRRRMELLASDMITRGLVLVSRKNFPQAQKIMAETKRILLTVLQSISRTLPHSTNSAIPKNRKEVLTIAAVKAMQAILQDLEILSEALEDNKELFAHDQRNLGAQQAMILRDQKSWTGRTATERLFWSTDHSIELVARSTDWVSPY